MAVAVWAACIQAVSVIIAVVALLRAVRSEANARQLAQHRDLDARRHEEERTRINRLAEIRIKFLHDAYLNLSLAGSMRAIGPENALPMIQALKDIQLLGNPEQVQLADQVVATFAARGGVNLDPLLDSLYDDCRDLLGIDPAERSRIVLSVLPMDNDQQTPGGHCRTVPLT
jgi:hypothetical protein